MKTIPPPDLGNLSALKIGDEVATVEPTENGVRVCAGVHIVHLIEPWRVLVRRPDRTVSGGGFKPETGKCFPGIYPNPYFYSANPEHIARGKQLAAEKQAAKQAQEEAFAALVALALPVAGQLVNPDDQTDSDGYKHNDAQDLAETLADRLTPEQIATLGGWLGIAS